MNKPSDRNAPNDTTLSDTWRPDQYNRFKAQRAQPFYDLLDLIEKERVRTAVDLGCGTGELTRELHEALPAEAQTLGIDSSAKMLEKAEPVSGLTFRNAAIELFAPAEKFDLVFSNAALQWLPDHETLLPRVLSWVAPGGQVAVQVPANFDHPSHLIATELAREFKLPNESVRKTLPVERYAEILVEAGFKRERCRTEVYVHRMASGEDVVEWVKGTNLTGYQKQMSSEDFDKFLAEYRARLLGTIGTGPYAYAFKRTLFWSSRS